MIKYNRAVLVRNLKEDKRFRAHLLKDIPFKSVMAVPLRTEGVIIGSLLLLNQDCISAFNEDDLAHLEKIAAIAAPFLRNVQKIQQYFAVPLPETVLLAKYKNAGLLGKCQRFTELLQAIEAAAKREVRVLLEGPSGTGKELIALAIHRFSSRHEHPFVAIDCGAIPANLLESELFGHMKGAFTGATGDRKGLSESKSPTILAITTLIRIMAVLAR